MASTGMIQIGVVVLALATMAWTGGIQAQSGCTSVLLSLAPCLSYVTGSSSTPSSSCCSQLASVVNTQPECLCTVLNGGGSVLGFNINQTLALALPMACGTNGMGLVVLVLVAMLWAGAAAQSSSCTNALISMSSCLNYITGNSSTPSSSCCTQLASVVRTQPECLCEVLNGSSSSMALNVNQTLALALPGACNVKTPSISNCDITI